MKKKILLTVGSFSASILPISAIIACSPSSSMGEKESKFLEALKSSDGVRKINNLWLDSTLKKLYEDNHKEINEDLISYVEFFMAEEIRKNNKYLTELNKSWAIELSGNDDIKKRGNLISKYKMGQYYDSFEDWTKELKKELKKEIEKETIFDTFIKDYLFDFANDKLGDKHQISIKTDFLVNVKKALIVKKYLGINKEDWMKVFGKEDNENLYDSALDSNKNVWDLIDEKEFPLILEGMRKHYAYSWNIKITDEDKVRELLEKEAEPGNGRPGEKKAQEMAKEFKVKDDSGIALANLSSRSDEKNKAFSEYSVLKNSNDDDKDFFNFVGYKGITTLPQGKGSLNFKWDDKKNWTSKNSPTNFNGFIEKDKLIRNENFVKYAEQSASEINLTLYNGNYLIPTYIKDKKIKFRILSDNDNPSKEESKRKENLYWTFIYQNKTLYEKAVQYYTNKEDPILFDASENKYLEKQLIDMGIKFIKKPE